MLLLVRPEFFYIVKQEEQQNHNTFPQQQIFELFTSHLNYSGGKFWYSDTTNRRRQTFKSSIPEFTLFNSHNLELHYIKKCTVLNIVHIFM